VRLAVADKDGARVLTEAEVDDIEEAVVGWKKLEADTLRGGIAPTSELEKPPSLEKPAGDA
jgi:hypothetical protein